MKTRNCSKCKLQLSITEFHRKSSKSGKLQSICKTCRSDYSKTYYYNHKDYFRAHGRKREAETRRYNQTMILEYLQNHPCVDCGESDPIVLEFDHEDPSSKFKGVGDLARSRYTWKTVLAEISKCSVRCANCHRRKTAKQFNHYRYKLSPVKN